MSLKALRQLILRRYMHASIFWLENVDERSKEMKLFRVCFLDLFKRFNKFLINHGIIISISRIIYFPIVFDASEFFR